MPDDPAAHRRRSEPIKVNSDPRCAGVDVRKGDSLTNWDILHKDRFHSSYYHIPKKRWEEIFGVK